MNLINQIELFICWKIKPNLISYTYSINSPIEPSTRSRSALPSRQSVSAFSPYLNYDPRILQQSQPEFIFPEGASKQRGRFELAFSQIGSSVLVSFNCRISIHWVNINCFQLYPQIGATLGGSVGLYNGVRATSLAQQTGKLRRTQWVIDCSIFSRII